MRTSRISRETARLMEHLAASPPKTRTRARSSLAPTASPSASSTSQRSSRRRAKAPTGSIATAGPDAAVDSPPSSAPTADIEDIPFAASPSPSRKRKRSTSPAVTTEIYAEETKTVGGGSGFPPKPRPQPAKETVDSSGAVTIHPPPLWKQQWTACEALRARNLAPVDTMGCDRLFDPASTEQDQRFQTLVALMLSPQTKDTVTAGAMGRLRSTLGARKGFTLQAVLHMDPAELDRLIIPVGFHNTKTRNIQLAAQMLVDRFNSDVPKDVDSLMELPGVGPKIAYLCLQAAWGITDGIGVDVHVHRISNRLGWHSTSTPEATRACLEKWLPRDKWGPVNHMLVGFGQTICKPVNPSCELCDLAEQGVCPSAVLPKGKKRSLLLGVKERLAKNGVLKKEEAVTVKVEEK